jgi:oxygen-dependent protoporphyrinogen oxidase
MYSMDDTRITEMVENELSRILRIKSDPLFTIIKRYPQAMPQYHVGHGELVERVQREIRKLDGLEIAGSAFGGVGIPDCINSGESAAERLFHSLYSGHV